MTHPAADRAPVFAALGDVTRLALLERLGASSSMSITALTEHTGVTRQAVTKHLQVLSRAGLVRDEARGRERIYRVSPEALDEVAAWIAEYRQQWEESFDRLDDYLQTLQAKDTK